MKTYTTVQGDLWDSIVYRQLGGTRYTDRLIAANLDYRDYYTFPAGIVLTIPEAAEAESTLPPWKRKK